MKSINLDALIQLRIKNKLTLDDMADALGLKTASAYWRIETGEVKLKAEHLPILAMKFGMSLEELVKQIFFTEDVA